MNKALIPPLDRKSFAWGLTAPPAADEKSDDQVMPLAPENSGNNGPIGTPDFKPVFLNAAASAHDAVVANAETGLTGCKVLEIAVERIKPIFCNEPGHGPPPNATQPPAHEAEPSGSLSIAGPMLGTGGAPGYPAAPLWWIVPSPERS